MCARLWSQLDHAAMAPERNTKKATTASAEVASVTRFIGLLYYGIWRNPSSSRWVSVVFSPTSCVVSVVFASEPGDFAEDLLVLPEPDNGCFVPADLSAGGFVGTIA
jgi:hypothetical protein